jgi:hypothetical protein
MEDLPNFPMDEPANYCIYIAGALESEWAKRNWGMTSTPMRGLGEPEQTMLSGEVADQGELVGIINGLYNAGYVVLSVERLRPEDKPPADDTAVEN